jgi:cadmium resistance protein CadD (predicted permease)
MNAHAKTYLKQFGGAMLLYIVVLFVSVRLLALLGGSPWRTLAALLPVLPIALGLLAFMRFFRSMDELQKRIQLDALAFSFGATGMLTFSYGLLQNAGLPQVPLLVVFPLMIALWGLGSVLAAQRFS